MEVEEKLWGVPPQLDEKTLAKVTRPHQVMVLLRRCRDDALNTAVTQLREKVDVTYTQHTSGS